MVLTARGRGVKFPHLYRPSLICTPDFILIEETSILPEPSTEFRLFSLALANTGGSRKSSGSYNELRVHHTQPTHLRRSEVDGER